MSAPRVLTAAALVLFFLGNLVLMRGPSAPEQVAVELPQQPQPQQPQPQPQPHEAASVLLAASTVRQLRSEVATTNALLDRPAAAWDDAGDPQGLRGGAGRQVEALEVGHDGARVAGCGWRGG